MVLARPKLLEPWGCGLGEFRILEEVFVARVIQGSIADKAGLQAGDAIIAINGRSTSSMSTAELLVDVHTGAELVLDLERALVQHMNYGIKSPEQPPHSVEVIIDRPTIDVNYGFGLGTDKATGATVVTNVAPPPAPAGKAGLQKEDAILTINGALAHTMSKAAIIELLLTSTSITLGVAGRRVRQRERPPIPPQIFREPLSTEPSGADVRLETFVASSDAALALPRSALPFLCHASEGDDRGVPDPGRA